MKKEIAEQINELLSEFEFNYQGESFDQVHENIQEWIYQQEIVYYSRAIEYLTENDPSLVESMELADEMGFSVINLNSEALATLLYQNELQTNFYELESELMELINQYEMEEEDEA